MELRNQPYAPQLELEEKKVFENIKLLCHNTRSSLPGVSEKVPVNF
jgi:hypothetical protein